MADFIHRYIPGKGRRTLLLLHGTGGDETSLLNVARVIGGEASMLAVRGNVLENGMPRFFRRLAEGVFDLEDLKLRTNELADFVVEASRGYGFSLGSLVSLGYSNGANIAASMLLLRPEAMSRAILLRAMVPFEPASLPNLKGKKVFMSSGARDPVVPKDNARRLEGILRHAGADVTANWELADHGLTMEELQRARSWLSRP